MTARSKVTLVEAQRIRAYLINTTDTHRDSYDRVADAIDCLLALGLIDTDVALKASEPALADD